MMKISKNKPSRQEFDNRAHEALRKRFDMAEDRIIHRGICPPHDVEEYLCREYIEQLSVTTFGICSFVRAEAENGAKVFLWGLCNTYGLPKLSNQRERECARQLIYHATYYFRDYYAILTKVFIEHLQDASDEDLTGYRYKAFFQIAAATIPNAREQIRREYRRRGLREPVLVGDSTLEHHMSASRRPLLGRPH